MFATEDRGIVVWLRPDRSFLCLGRFDGINVKCAAPLDTERCVLLLDPDAVMNKAFQNAICIDRNANVIWKARLPENRDAFVSMGISPEGLITLNSWSCFQLLLDPATGQELKRVWTK